MKGTLINRLKKNERGTAVLEFALILGILLMLVVGIIEFGWLFNGYIALTGAAREGARFAVLGKDDQVDEAVENHLGHLKDQFVNLSVNPGSAQTGEERTVEVSGRLPLLVGFFPFLDDPYYLEAKATMRQEYSY